MTDDTTAPTYWLLLDQGPPLGPFTFREILAKQNSANFAAARICAVGESTWSNLKDHPEFARPAPLAANDSVHAGTATVAPVDSQPAAPGSNPPSSKLPEWIPTVIGPLVVAFAIYLLYEWFRPLTPREVVERFVNAKSVEDAKQLCMPDFYAVVATLYLLDDHTNDDNDFAITDERSESGKQNIVGFRGTSFDKAAARRVPITGFITLQKSDNWKVADMSFSTYDGQALPEPFSLVKNHRLLLEETQNNKQLKSSTKPASGTRPTADDKSAQRGLLLILCGFLKTGGAKAIGLCVLGIGAGIFGVLRSKNTNKISYS